MPEVNQRNETTNYLWIAIIFLHPGCIINKPKIGFSIKAPDEKKAKDTIYVRFYRNVCKQCPMSNCKPPSVVPKLLNSNALSS